MLSYSDNSLRKLTTLITIDRLDSQILDRLTRNARMGLAELSNQLGVARNTVQARLRGLQTSGALTGFRPAIDLEAVGVPVQAFVGLELDQRQLDQVVEGLTAMPGVLEINTQAGREDLLVRVASETHAELQRTVTEMIDVPGVRRSTTTLIVSTPLPFRTQPLLDHLTRDAGYGRSTPLPLDEPSTTSGRGDVG